MESENGEIGQVLLHGVGRAALPLVCLGGLNSPGRFLSLPLKIEAPLKME